ncbi:hypothetical protein [Candidatus Uabimicrobium sp. HlEnr_7]|uniref:hypothetical protein n=1 Tax=Candidatus Uabimicrobium helgolandensis TaxID=3095367 RepID=UPI0035565242
MKKAIAITNLVALFTAGILVYYILLYNAFNTVSNECMMKNPIHHNTNIFVENKDIGISFKFYSQSSIHRVFGTNYAKGFFINYHLRKWIITIGDIPLILNDNRR